MLANRHDLDERCRAKLPDGHFETLGGFLVGPGGSLSGGVGEVRRYQGWRCEICSMDGHRVDRVAVGRAPVDEPRSTVWIFVVSVLNGFFVAAEAASLPAAASSSPMRPAPGRGRPVGSYSALSDALAGPRSASPLPSLLLGLFAEPAVAGGVGGGPAGWIPMYKTRCSTRSPLHRFGT